MTFGTKRESVWFQMYGTRTVSGTDYVQLFQNPDIKW